MSQATRLAATEATLLLLQNKLNAIEAAAANPPAPHQPDPEIGNLQAAIGAIARRQDHAALLVACNAAVNDAVSGNDEANIELIKIFRRIMSAWHRCDEWGVDEGSP